MEVRKVLVNWSFILLFSNICYAQIPENDTLFIKWFVAKDDELSKNIPQYELFLNDIVAKTNNRGLVNNHFYAQNERVFFHIFTTFNLDKAQKALLDFKESLLKYTKEKNDLASVRFLNQNALFHYMKGELKPAEEIYGEIIEILNNKKNLIISEYNILATAYMNKGDINLINGNYNNAIDNIIKRIEIREKKTKSSPGYLAIGYEGLAKAYLKSSQPLLAEICFEKAQNLLNAEIKLKDSNFNFKTIFSVSASISEYYVSKSKFEKASQLLNTAFSYIPKNDFIFHSYYYHKQSLLYATKKDTVLTLNMLDKALLNAIKGYKTTRHIDISKIYLDITKYTNPKSHYRIKNIQSALISLSQQFNSTDYRNNPSVSDVFSKKDLLETLDFKTGLLLDMAKKQPQYLDAAYQTAQLAAGLIDTIRADYTSDFDKQYLAEWSYGVYEKAIESAYQLYQKTGNKAYLNTAFNAFERSKAIVLLEALRTGQAESALNDDDRNRLYQYKSELQKLEAQIYDETTKNKKAPDDPSVRSLQNRLFDIRRNYEALVKSFETRYPEYYRIKFGQNFAQLKEIQALLPNDGSALTLEYFVGEKAIYTFSISKTDCQLFKTEKPKDFDTRIETMRNVLAMNNTQTYIAQASWLYNLILKTPLSTRQLNTKKLIIIPDGILNYVPFEMLLDSDIPVLNGNKYNNLPFLIKKYTISYAYSGNLLKQQSHVYGNGARELFAGFAAQYKPQEAPQLAMRAALTRDNAYDLPYAQKEVSDINAIIGGSLFTKDKSGERYFKDNAAYYKILHFAMHAVPDSINPVQSKLLFTYNPVDTIEDNDLTAAEIYAMRLNAQLAVLSACQTGYGKINRGEGVMSLSRAFAYSGVNATVMSLWRVADFSTREIMVEFYKNLKKGQTKDEALRNAKLAYIDNHPQDELKNPYYWAGFVAAGNMSAMDMTDMSMIRWIAVGILALIVGLILYVRGFKK